MIKVGDYLLYNYKTTDEKNNGILIVKIIGNNDEKFECEVIYDSDEAYTRLERGETLKLCLSDYWRKISKDEIMVEVL